MKRLIFLFFLPLLFSCSSNDDENSTDLTGRYISDEAGIIEVFTLELTSKSGTYNNYDKGAVKDKQSFTYSTSGKTISFTYSNGKTETFNFSQSEKTLIIGDVVYRKVPSESFTSFRGHTYIAVDWIASTHGLLYLIYKFNEDGSIEIEERKNSVDGELYDSSVGLYSYKEDALVLEIPSIGTSYNEFWADLHSDYKSFTYLIYDISIGKDRTLFFYADK